MHGLDLQQAEAWLLRSGATEPHPSELHTQYILASRQAANARQRLPLSGVLVALVISIGLALLAFAQYRTAEVQRAIAVDSALAATIAQGQARIEAANAQTAQADAVANNANETQSLLLFRP